MQRGLILLMFCSLLAVASVYAQPAEFGIQAGSGWHILRNRGGAFFNEPLVLTGIGFGSAGGYASLPVKGEFRFRTEWHLHYRSIAGQVKLDVDEEAEELQIGIVKSAVRDLFAELPFLAEYRLNKEISTVVGLSVNGLLFSVKEQLPTDSVTVVAPQLSGAAAMDNRNRVELAYVIGGQFTFSDHWGMGLRFVRSLTNFYRAAAYRSFSLRYATWSLNGTYRF